MNRELGAQAFAHGSDVYFGPGKSPGNNELTAHELTHVVQQTGAVQAKLIMAQVMRDPLDGGSLPGGLPDEGQTAQAAKVAKMSADFEAYVQKGEWDQAALVLNGFAMFDILPRVAKLVSEQWDKLKNAATETMKGSPPRVQFAVEVVKNSVVPANLKDQINSDQVGDVEKFLASKNQKGNPGTKPATNKEKTLPSADELTARIARCIGIWETNRGKDNPEPKESSLDTVAGVHASMATIEQATMPYAISALKKYKSLRDKATPPLTMAELNSAEARCNAVSALLKSVSKSSEKGETPDEFIKNNTSAVAATGLSNDDVQMMFGALELRATLDTALIDANAAGKTAKEEAQKAKKTAKQQKAAEHAAKKKSINESIDAIPAQKRLGLGKGSLTAYINKPKNWGENRAGWQRKAVSLMPNNVGNRIESVAVSDNGTALAIPVVGSRVAAELAKMPVPSLENIVKTVAQKNNPGEKGYGENVWKIYNRLYG
jgi:hypothetical protein